MFYELLRVWCVDAVRVTIMFFLQSVWLYIYFFNKFTHKLYTYMIYNKWEDSEIYV